MATFAANTMILHIAFAYRLHNQLCQNGFYFANKGSMSDDFLDERVLAFGLRFIAAIVPEFQDVQNQQVQYIGVVVSTLNPKNGPMAEIPIINSTGNQPDEALPSYCAAILSLRTGFGGKTNRGRIYVAGIGENEHSAGQLLPDTFTALNGIGVKLLSDFGPTGSDPYFHHIIFSKKFGYSGGNFNAAGVRTITHYVPRKILGTQRHRLIGHGT